MIKINFNLIGQFITIFLLSIAYSISFVDLQAKPRKWTIKDYKKTTISNFKKNAILKQQINLKKIDYPALNAALFYETNLIRKKNGKKILKHHVLLEKAAFNHSKHMAKNNYFSHNTQPGGMDTAARLKKLNIINANAAENIAVNFGIKYESGKSVYTPAKGQFSYSATGKPLIQPYTYIGLASAILNQWMKSPSHKKNILSKDAVQLGCGAYESKDTSFNDLPLIKATQNFQWFESIKTK